MKHAQNRLKNLLIAAIVTLLPLLASLPQHVSAQTATNPITFTIQAGGTSHSNITITNNTGAMATFNLATSALPTGFTVSIVPNSVTLSNGSTQAVNMALTVASNTAVGSYLFNLISNNVAISNVIVTVVAAPVCTPNLATISPLSASLPQPANTLVATNPILFTIKPGSIINTNITVTNNTGAAATFNLATSALPAGFTVSIVPNVVTLNNGSTQTVNIALKVASNTKAGSYVFALTSNTVAISNVIVKVTGGSACTIYLPVVRHPGLKSMHPMAPLQSEEKQLFLEGLPRAKAFQ